MPLTTDNGEEELLAVRRAFQTTQTPDDQWLRHDVFRTRCTVGEKVCSLIIDAYMEENVVSARVIEKLHLPTWRHPQPYFLYGLKKRSAIIIDQMCLIDFSIGNRLHEQVWCDVVPMDTCHILLGQPWQLDRKAVYDEFKNTYSFTKAKKKIMLLPMRAEATTEPLTREITVSEEEERSHMPKYPHVQIDSPPTELAPRRDRLVLAGLDELQRHIDDLFVESFQPKQPASLNHTLEQPEVQRQHDDCTKELPKEEVTTNIPLKEETNGTRTTLPQPPIEETSWVMSKNETIDMVLPPEPLKTGAQLLFGYNSQSLLEYKYLPTTTIPKVDLAWTKMRNRKVSVGSISKLRFQASGLTSSQKSDCSLVRDEDFSPHPRRMTGSVLKEDCIP